MKGRLRIPAEWERHACCWAAFPHLREEWPFNLEAAQQTIASLCRAIAEEGREPVRLLVRNAEVRELAKNAIGNCETIEYVTTDYGDCWVRDTLPLLGHESSGGLGALHFQFNGWGDKYVMPGDDRVGRWLIEQIGAVRFASTLILEGGALEYDGAGTFITTASCALNRNRNPGTTRDQLEAALSSMVDVERLIWLERGLDHDHTDGHVDMLARFVAPGAVVCTRAEKGDPNAEVRRQVERQLRDAGLDVRTLPSPGPLFAPDGTPLPATYCNFYVANEAVLLPLYEVDSDDQASAELGRAFPGRKVIGLSARDLLWGGGAFHCVTQPQPAV